MLTADEYPSASTFRDYDPHSKTHIVLPMIGACLEVVGIFNGDIGIHDTAVEIKSGDLVLVEPKTKGEKPMFEYYVKRLEYLAARWWLASVDGLIPLIPEHHNIVARCVCVAQRRRTLPMQDREGYEAIVAGSTPDYRAHLERQAAPALAALARDGLDRATVYRQATA